MQVSAKAQSGQEYQRIKNSADSLAKIKEFPKSEAMYLKALKVCNQDPLLHINLASLYLKVQKTNEARKFMESAVVLGADMDMLLRDAHIANYLSINQEQYARYSFLGKRQKALIQLENKFTWVDDFRKRF
jgi:tetratricopeptide (TPR) repeat protein